jgi:adenine phosphoribosyltransferase
MSEDRRARERAVVLEQFRWVAGHADVWGVFADARAFALAVEALAWPWRDAGVTEVCGIESRGFVLGGAVAHELGAGFVAIRKADGLLPGEKLHATSHPTIGGRRKHCERSDSTSMQATVSSWSTTGPRRVAKRWRRNS